MKWIIALFSLVLVVVLIVVYWSMDKGAQTQKVILKLPKGSLEIQMGQDRQIDHRTVLEEIFKDDYAKSAAEAWLRDNHDKYDIADPQLIDKIRNLCPDIPEEPILERQERLKRCASKTHLIEALRELASKHQPPFQYIGNAIKVGTQIEEGHRP